MSNSTYRKDIDGLRAVAVLAVVLFHLGLPIHGGFVGVDIFFTISGFLIGSIIIRENAAGEFTLKSFYERRVRRIFPALFAMLLLSALIAYLFLLPAELIEFARSLTAAAASASNFLFWSEAGYFDGAAASKPLLHTWSLAVEEQFYIFFPLFVVWLAKRYPDRVGVAIYVTAAFSFVASAYGAYAYPSATFYAPYTRAWELLTGTALALRSFPRISSQNARNVAGLAGISAILFAVLFFNSATPFPGLAALLPCLGTAAIIAAGSEGRNVIGRVLSSRPLVFVGLISYSLYLWHWPLIVFSSVGISFIDGLTRRQGQVLLLFFSFILATISWRFIETPFRVGILRPTQRNLFIGAFAGLAVFASYSGLVIAYKGIPTRFSEDAFVMAKWLEGDPIDGRDQYRHGSCFLLTPGSTLANFQKSLCLPDRTGLPRLLLLGDSHAAAMWWGLNTVLKDANIMQATASGCKPVLTQRPRQSRQCAEVMDYVLRNYLVANKVGAVLLEARWDEGDIPSIGETLSWLKGIGIHVILVGPNVQYDTALPRLLAYSVLKSDPSLPSRHKVRAMQSLDRKMSELAANDWQVPYISLFEITCAREVCVDRVSKDVPLLSDYGHFTKQGSIWIAERILPLGILLPRSVDDRYPQP